LFTALVESILLYGCSTWTLTKNAEVLEWYIYTYAKNGTECKLDTSHDK